MTKGERKILKNIQESLRIALKHADEMGFQEYDISNQRALANVVGELDHSLQLIRLLEEE